MDISRGSRRARHVAANGNANGNVHSSVPGSSPATITAATTLSPHGLTPSHSHGRFHSAIVTPDAPQHRTPDQPVPERQRPPPPNPFRLHRTARMSESRLTMPSPMLDSDDTSEPDLSVLGLARPGPVSQHHITEPSYDDIDDEILSQDQYEAEETSLEEEHDIEDEEDDNDITPLIDPATAGLKEISNLGKFTVSSHKPGNGVEELRSDDLKRFWQSDGPQPHKVTVYFVKRVGIRDIRFYVDYTEDESYTPTKVVFKSGTSENNLVEFASMTLESPVGWQQVPIAGAGGDPDGNTLVSYVLQMQILENHQNGKDTHLRGIKIYAFDSESTKGVGRERNPIDEVIDFIDNPINHKAMEVRGKRTSLAKRYEPGEGGLTITDLMREPEIR